jgi:hypothetical protein
MGWERRERGGLYYTRSRRVDGRVVREYVGRGLVGELAARLDVADRERRLAQRAADRKQDEGLDSADAAVSAFCEVSEILARASLLLAGYHRHDRGEWRRRRG